MRWRVADRASGLNFDRRQAAGPRTCQPSTFRIWSYPDATNAQNSVWPVFRQVGAAWVAIWLRNSPPRHFTALVFLHRSPGFVAPVNRAGLAGDYYSWVGWSITASVRWRRSID